MNSSGLLEPSYLLIGPGLKLLGQVTCLSPGARAWNVPLPGDVVACTRECRWGDSFLALFIEGQWDRDHTLPTDDSGISVDHCHYRSGICFCWLSMLGIIKPDLTVASCFRANENS
jgi:hypothetical protein